MSGGYSLLFFHFFMNISNVCNRKCKVCPYHSPHLKMNKHLEWVRKQPDFMSFYCFYKFFTGMGLFRKLITSISITGKGEPLLHPHLFRFCYLFDDYKIPYTITTNGDRLTPETCNYLSELRYLKTVRISVFENPDKWIKLQRERQDVPIELYNMIGGHIEGLADGYTIPSEGTEEFCSMPKNFNKKFNCKSPFTFGVLNTDGSFVPCYSRNEVGSWEQSFWSIWNGKKMRKFRMDAMRGKAELAPCKNCGYFLRK
jgi:MoaA/NifB/PqqE/SkfB family radical SAM enzyme